ncbi:hypothetical protein Tco_0977985 [Tanacetum coccineum]|uniref:Uncharacterized protein n=1 Tax=Tanacetum coccineum TaxID=301880 RepID=A0ABQ5ELN3_9ASTR
MIRMLQDINRENLQTLWKLVKTKHGDIRHEDEHERVLWGDLKVMFEPDIKSDVWRKSTRIQSDYLEVFKGELLGVKDFKMILRVTAAQVYAAGLQLLEELLLSEDKDE